MKTAKPSLTTQNLCGPFDQQFIRKFRGRKQHSLSIQHLKLAKHPTSHNNDPKAQTYSSLNILPKLKEIENLAKSQRKKPQKANKYVDGVSQLELYLAKKLVNNLTTQQIVSKIMQSQSAGFENRKVVTENYLRMTAHVSENKKFHELGQQSPHTTTQEERFAKTQYSPSKKWVSDKEFVQKFDKFIIKNHKDDAALDKESEKGTDLNEEEAVRQIRSDKQTITRIAKEMIAEQNNDLWEQEEIKRTSDQQQSMESSSFGEPHGIEWIIKECSEFESRFRVKKRKSKAKR